MELQKQATLLTLLTLILPSFFFYLLRYVTTTLLAGILLHILFSSHSLTYSAAAVWLVERCGAALENAFFFPSLLSPPQKTPAVELPCFLDSTVL